MRKSSQIRAAVAATCIILAIGSANAASVIDQSNIAVPPAGGQVIYQIFGEPINTNPPGTPAGNFISASGIQFVTTGITGSLSAVDLQLTRFVPNNTGGMFDFIIAKDVVFGANGAVTGANVLATISSNISSLAAAGGVVNFDTSSFGLSFNAGDKFAIAVGPRDNVSGVFGWAAGTSADAPGTPFNPATFIGNPYAGGDALRGVAPYNAGDQLFTPHVDFGFRTYVAGVPEPGTWAMMLLGFGIIGGAMRSTKRRQKVTLSLE